MRAILAIGTLMFGSGAAQAAPDQSIPMGPGSLVYWTSAYDGGNDQFRETLLVQGDDYALFRTDSDWAAGDASDYFALFSGIYFTACDTDMPTAEERAALATLWPLTEGATLEITSGDGATFTVGGATEFFLMGQTYPAHTLTGSYSGDEPSEESFVVLDQMPLTVALQWDDNSRDTAMLVTRPKSVASTQVDTDLIGNCASLLNNQTNEN